MIKIVFLGFPLHGHTSPAIGLVKELVNSGQQVIFYSIPEYKEMITHAGAEFRDYNTGLNAKSLPNGKNPFLNLNTIYNKGMEIFDKLVDELETMNPDLIIHDGVSWWGKCLAAYLKIPAATSIVTFAMNPELLKVGVSKSGILKFLFSRFFSKEGKQFPITMTKYNQLLKKCGLPTSKNFNPIEFSNNPQGLNLVYATDTWQPQRETFNDTFRFIGPSITSRGDEKDFILPDKGDFPLVYISMGTMVSKNLKFFNMCFKALGSMNVTVVLSLGKEFDQSQLNNVPDNFHLYSYVPQCKVLEQADLFITHGGMNSVNESLYYSIPMVIYPISSEQTLNGQRTVEAGAGIMPQKQNVESLERAVKRVLNDPCYRMNAEIVSQDFKQSGGPEQAVQEIQNYLEKQGVKMKISA